MPSVSARVINPLVTINHHTVLVQPVVGLSLHPVSDDSRFSSGRPDKASLRGQVVETNPEFTGDAGAGPGISNGCLLGITLYFNQLATVDGTCTLGLEPVQSDGAEEQAESLV